MQHTPEQGKRIGVCQQYLKKKIAAQIQHLLTQVFTGGIIFPGLLSPSLLCASQLTPAGTFLRSQGTKGKWIVCIDFTTQEVSDQLQARLVFTVSLAGLTSMFSTCSNRIRPALHFLLAKAAAVTTPGSPSKRPFPGARARWLLSGHNYLSGPCLLSPRRCSMFVFYGQGN